MNPQKPPPLPQPNTSGQWKTASVPREIRKWSWPGFVLSWIWGIFNGVPIALIALFANFVPCIGTIVALGMVIWLGQNGNELAWRNQRWESVEKFLEVQRKWTRWSIIVLIAVAAGAATVALVMLLGPPRGR